MTDLQENLQDFYHVLVIEDPKNRRIVFLEDNVYSIGREPENSIVIYEDRRVSRYHATILRKKDVQSDRDYFSIIDGNLEGHRSTNGLLINGKHSLSHDLEHGDKIRFGDFSQAIYYLLADTASIKKLFKTPLPIDRDTLSKIESKTTKSQKTKFKRQLNKLTVENLIKISSFTELSPYPIIEIDFQGNIIYLNEAASTKFNNIHQAKLNHPILAGIVRESKYKNVSSFVREVTIGKEVFEQYIHFLPQRKLIRSYIFDFTDRKRQQLEIEQREKLYRAVVEQSTEGIFLIDFTNKKILEANAVYCQMLGYTLEEIRELTLYDIVDLVDISQEKIDRDLENIYQEKSYFVEESKHRRKDGYLINVEVSTSAIAYGAKNLFSFAVRDITKRKRFQEMLQYQAFHDLLTDLPNRTLFNEQLSTAIANANRNQNKMAVMFMDLDRFKNINDTLGHGIGDRLLKSFAQRVKSCLREGDTVARWGGDEFTVLLPQIGNAEEAAKVAQRILDTLKPTFELEQYQLNVKSSIGIALYPPDGKDNKTLIKNADAALYRAKEQGRNNYRFFSLGMTSQTYMLSKLENLLHQALEQEEFFLYYQPQVNILTGKITGIEALLRWQDPQRGLVLPKEFIPLAEETGLIVPIGQWVLETACNQNKAWQSAGLALVPIAVNLSPRQFLQANLVSVVAKILAKTELAPHWLELEITEASIIKNVDFASKVLGDLQRIGVRLCLDDFGTGFSGFTYLKNLPFHTLKIDRSCAEDLQDNPQDQAIISAAIALGQGFNLRVLTEGVETQQQIELLRILQCQEIQGDWFTKPLTAKEATKFLSLHTDRRHQSLKQFPSAM